LVAGVATVILPRRELSSSGQPLRVLPLTTELGFESYPTFSPDGNQVAFQWNKGGGDSHIYIKQIGSGDPVRLTSGSQAEFAPAWSRDGRYIAFLRELDASRTGIFYVPPLGGVERLVTECPNPYIWRGYMLRRLDWTPDGKNLIVSCPDTDRGNNALKVVSLSGVKSPLTTPSGTPNSGDEEPAVSPDGSAVVFVRWRPGAGRKLFVLSLNADLKAAGEPRELAETRGASAPAWMASGKEIVYDRGGVLWRVAVAGGPPRRVLEVGTGVRQPTFDRANRLAYAVPVGDSNIWRQELTSDGTAAQPAAPLIAFTTLEMSPDYSPDDTRIAFQSQRSGTATIWVCARDGTRCSPLTDMQSGSPRWSPNSQFIAFDSHAAGNWDVLVMPAKGGEPRPLTSDRANDTQPSWSRDGNWIYFSSARSGRDEVWKAPAIGGAAVKITRDGGHTAVEAADGKIYYTKSDNETSLWRCNPDGSGETLVLDAVAYRGFAVAVDRIYYMRPAPGDSRTLWVRYLDTGKDKQISVVPNTGRLGLSLSPDHRYLVYAQLDREGSDLMWVPDFR
jgi:Tol biopolymer transport system component